MGLSFDEIMKFLSNTLIPEFFLNPTGNNGLGAKRMSSSQLMKEISVKREYPKHLLYQLEKIPISQHFLRTVEEEFNKKFFGE